MAGKNRNIELRSEKARRIIGEVPPFLVRSGIGMITAVVITLFVAAATVPCPESVTVDARLFSFGSDKVSLTLSADSLTASRISGNVRFSFESDNTASDARAVIHGSIDEIVTSTPLTVIASADLLSARSLPVDSSLTGQCRLLFRNRTLISIILSSIR